MISFQDVYDAIHNFLTGRQTGTYIDEHDHEAAEILFLNYVKQLEQQFSGSIFREAHAASTAGVSCNLTWSKPFDDTDYSEFINGFDSLGNPVEIYKISKSSTKMVVRTLVNASITAIAIPYGGITG